MTQMPVALLASKRLRELRSPSPQHTTAAHWHCIMMARKGFKFARTDRTVAITCKEFERLGGLPDLIFGSISKQKRAVDPPLYLYIYDTDLPFGTKVMLHV